MKRYNTRRKRQKDYKAMDNIVDNSKEEELFGNKTEATGIDKELSGDILRILERKSGEKKNE